MQRASITMDFKGFDLEPGGVTFRLITVTMIYVFATQMVSVPRYMSKVKFIVCYRMYK